MTRLLICRHGRTSWNAAHRVQGHSDVGLDEVGHAEARRAAASLAVERPDVLVSSDLRRARETAGAIADVTGLPIVTDPLLRERAYGIWEGLTDDEIAVGYPEENKRWRTGLSAPIDGVENQIDVGKRMVEALNAAADRAPDGTVLVVTHGGSAKRGCGALLGWPDEAWATLSGLDNCHWIELRRRGAGWRLYGYNLGAPPVTSIDTGASGPNPDAF